MFTSAKLLYRSYAVKKISYPSVTAIISETMNSGVIRWEGNLILKTFIESLKTELKNGSISQETLKAIETNARKAPEQIRKKASSWGNQSHSLIDKKLSKSTLPPSLSASSEVMLNNLDIWIQKEQFTFTDLNVYVNSSKYKYCGYIDAIGFDKNQNPVIIDFKTGKTVVETMTFQLAAYVEAYNEMSSNQKQVKDAYILHFPSNSSELTVYKLTNIDTSFQYFKHCLGLYTFLHSKDSLLSPL
ncbi:hypothetical protein WA158_004916 [Blastocystis sp. Blastoise]